MGYWIRHDLTNYIQQYTMWVCLIMQASTVVWESDMGKLLMLCPSMELFHRQARSSMARLDSGYIRLYKMIKAANIY